LKNWIIVNDNCKLSNVPSGIAPAKQAWIPIENNYSSINAAQPSVQITGHLPLKGVLIFQQALFNSKHKRINLL
jgi:hypothetical protein